MKTEQLAVFSERLKALRGEKKLRQSDIAALLECGVRHYQKIEHGEINVPSLDLLFLADYFEVSMDYLLGRTEVREVNR